MNEYDRMNPLWAEPYVGNPTKCEQCGANVLIGTYPYFLEFDGISVGRKLNMGTGQVDRMKVTVTTNFKKHVCRKEES